MQLKPLILGKFESYWLSFFTDFGAVCWCIIGEAGGGNMPQSGKLILHFGETHWTTVGWVLPALLFIMEWLVTWDSRKGLWVPQIYGLDCYICPPRFWIRSSLSPERKNEEQWFGNCYLDFWLGFDLIQSFSLQGVLSAMVLSLIPIIRPFEWQCLLLPVSLTTCLLEFFDLHFASSCFVGLVLSFKVFETTSCPLLIQMQFICICSWS